MSMCCLCVTMGHVFCPWNREYIVLVLMQCCVHAQLHAYTWLIDCWDPQNLLFITVGVSLMYWFSCVSESCLLTSLSLYYLSSLVCFGFLSISCHSFWHTSWTAVWRWQRLAERSCGKTRRWTDTLTTGTCSCLDKIWRLLSSVRTKCFVSVMALEHRVATSCESCDLLFAM